MWWSQRFCSCGGPGVSVDVVVPALLLMWWCRRFCWCGGSDVSAVFYSSRWRFLSALLSVAHVVVPASLPM
ncbi:hypothetical protein CBR_g8237 [Chara braunii]|uniref:Uncharacterized protein n=1 Tax=Chara braunii TaxID=69332 RepID=A0A388KLK8_CHABU|nr:hypothetical protein CBR_g8237 [Chara braunii]|eukprot:GBG70936.1 hypothetical protein CBR_g8237 [Chara braunii]